MAIAGKDTARKRRQEDDQRKREAFALEIFLRVLGKPHGTPERGRPGDQPDFMVEIDGEQVGVEFTETVGSRRREQEELRHKIVGKARERYVQGGGPPLDAWFLWSDDPVPKDSTIPDRIVRLVNSAKPADLPLHEGIALTPEQIEAHGLPFLASVRLMRRLAGRTSTWGITDAGTVLSLETSDVQVAIANKELALRRFLDALGCEPWLVIYTFDDRVSGSADLAPQAATASYPTRFRKVFVLAAAPGRVVSLQVRPPQTAERE